MEIFRRVKERFVLEYFLVKNRADISDLGVKIYRGNNDIFGESVTLDESKDLESVGMFLREVYREIRGNKSNSVDRAKIFIPTGCQYQTDDVMLVGVRQPRSNNRGDGVGGFGGMNFRI